MFKFKFKLENELKEFEELDYIRDCEIQSKDGLLFFITYSNSNYYEGLLLTKYSDNITMEAKPVKFNVDELHNISGYEELVSKKLGIETLDIFLDFNKITFIDKETAKVIYDNQISTEFEYMNDRLERRLSDNLYIYYYITIDDFNVTGNGYIYDKENQIKISDNIFKFHYDTICDEDEIADLFEYLNIRELNEEILK